MIHPLYGKYCISLPGGRNSFESCLGGKSRAHNKATIKSVSGDSSPGIGVVATSRY